MALLFIVLIIGHTRILRQFLLDGNADVVLGELDLEHRKRLVSVI